MGVLILSPGPKTLTSWSKDRKGVPSSLRMRFTWLRNKLSAKPGKEKPPAVKECLKNLGEGPHDNQHPFPYDGQGKVI